MSTLEAGHHVDTPDAIDDQRQKIWDKVFTPESRKRIKGHAMVLLAVFFFAFAGRAIDSRNKPVDIPPLSPDAVLVQVNSSDGGVKVNEIVYVNPPTTDPKKIDAHQYRAVRVTAINNDGFAYIDLGSNRPNFATYAETVYRVQIPEVSASTSSN